jgi:hypothetical protein
LQIKHFLVGPADLPLPPLPPALAAAGNTLKQKRATLVLKDMALAKVDISNANPYAGITQVRFKGYLLSPYRHPCFVDYKLTLIFF